MTADRRSGPEHILCRAVLMNLVFTGVHGVVHWLVPVRAQPWQLAVLVVGLALAPLAGATAVHSGRRAAGVALLGGGAGLALAMEGPWHFLLANPDHVAHANGGIAFTATAVGTTVGDLLVIVIAVWAVVRLRAEAPARGPAGGPSTDEG